MGRLGIEPRTFTLKGCCSTAELPPQRCYNYTLSTAPSSSGPGRLAFIQEIMGSIPIGVTILEIERGLGAALAAPPSADSAAKA